MDSSVQDILKRKQQTRAEALARRDALGDSLRAEKSTLISQRLIQLDQFQKARCIFVYVAVRSEVHTAAIVQAALAQGKKVCVPLIIDVENKEMAACAITDPARDLCPGTMGIPEPDRNTCEPVPESKIDLVIVPGLAFTVKGHRIGYGGGCYDRFLNQFSGENYALAFEEQIVDSLPFDPGHDVIVSRIITDEREIICG